jgi:hypothetical protein
MLAAWNAGDAHAFDRLMGLVYPEVRQIAGTAARWGEP